MRDKNGIDIHSGDLVWYESDTTYELYVVCAYKNQIYAELNKPYRTVGQGFWVHKKNKVTKITKELLMLRKLEECTTGTE